MTSVLRTARISNVESALCRDRVRKMINFELSLRIKKDVKFICHERGVRLLVGV